MPSAFPELKRGSEWKEGTECDWWKWDAVSLLSREIWQRGSRKASSSGLGSQVFTRSGQSYLSVSKYLPHSPEEMGTWTWIDTHWSLGFLRLHIKDWEIRMGSIWFLHSVSSWWTTRHPQIKECCLIHVDLPFTSYVPEISFLYILNFTNICQIYLHFINDVRVRKLQ